MTATAILRTLAYADIFSYPLTAKEIHRWLISRQRVSVSSINSAISALLKTHSKVKRVGNYYALAGRSQLALLRRRRRRLSQAKLREAKRVGEWLKIIPTISAVSVTGALSMNNADKYDDIDLLIVTTPHTLWLTRLLTVFLTELLGVRRRPLPRESASNQRQSASTNNKICLNLWLDETSLTIPKLQRNLYTAHEVAQTKTLWSRPARRSPETSRKGEGGGEAKEKLLIHNRWVKHFLANIKIPPIPMQEKLSKPSLIVNKANQFAFSLQRLYMKSRLTREIVTLHAAFFHPKNTKRRVVKQYHHRLRQLNLRP